MDLKNKLEFALFQSFSKFFSLFGIDRAKYFASLLAFIFFYLIPLRKGVVLNNLKTAFPDLDKRQIKKLAYKNYKSFAIVVIEIMCIPSLSEEKLQEKIKCDDIDIINEKYKEKNSIILLTGHFGNWELGAMVVGLLADFHLSVLVKTQRNRIFSKWMNKAREKFGNSTIVLKKGYGAREIFKSLKSGGGVGIVGDQRGKRESIRVKFFGKDTPLFSGSAAIALKTRVPTFVLLAARQSDYNYKFFAEELNFDNLPEDKEEAVRELTQRYISVIERYTRQYPEQWLWMHNIWKF
jgi:KDO2-lipid IV(A) lauroyltransferase